MSALADGVTFMITDVVDGPWMCTDSGPFACMENVIVRKEHVTMFDLRDVLAEFQPDLLMMFGTWRVLARVQATGG